METPVKPKTEIKEDKKRQDQRGQRKAS